MTAPRKHQDFLVEIGTEELPPKSLHSLIDAFAAGIERGLTAAGLTFATIERFASPRRLAVRARKVVIEQPPQEIRRSGPPVASSFDEQGQPTRAALGFAASCGVTIEALGQAEGPKGKVLSYSTTQPGQPAAELLPDIVRKALAELPIAKRMRWGTGDAEFVRPVHWVVLLLGNTPLPAEILGIKGGNTSRGHRFHAPGPLKISSPARYEAILKSRGKVLVDLAERRERTLQGVKAAAEAIGGTAVIAESLLEEVVALVEWPVPIAGRFDDRFLELPTEVPVAVMQDHQRYFPVEDSGRLLPWFIAVANIESSAPEKVRAGNERVIRPRLADAAFFWETDRRERLEAHREALRSVTFQQGLGSLYDKSERIVKLATTIAGRIGGSQQHAARAAALCKCDLLSLMVGEFPELQGTMGRDYAQHDGEPDEVATAIAEHYLPRFAGDRLPESAAGMAVAIADRLDTIAGIFAIGQKPTGTRDPFGLRRAALGVLRLVIERRLDLDLSQLIRQVAESLPISGDVSWQAAVYDYIMERLRAYYLEDSANSAAITAEMFDAVLANRPGSPLDFDARIRALEVFLQHDDAASLASANKRIANILRKVQDSGFGAVNADLLTEPAEKALFAQVLGMEQAISPLIARREYTPALAKLAGLRSTVDQFFDTVMVMTEDTRIRENRLALLARLRKLFLHVADLSRLPGQ